MDRGGLRKCTDVRLILLRIVAPAETVLEKAANWTRPQGEAQNNLRVLTIQRHAMPAAWLLQPLMGSNGIYASELIANLVGGPLLINETQL